MATLSVTASPATISETGGVSTVTVSTADGVTTYPEDQTITLSVDGTATESADYMVSSKTLTLEVGQTEVTATVTAKADTVDEADETVLVTATHDSETVGEQQTITIDRRRHGDAERDGESGDDLGDGRRLDGDGEHDGRGDDVSGGPDHHAERGRDGDGER